MKMKSNQPERYITLIEKMKHEILKSINDFIRDTDAEFTKKLDWVKIIIFSLSEAIFDIVFKAEKPSTSGLLLKRKVHDLIFKWKKKND